MNLNTVRYGGVACFLAALPVAVGVPTSQGAAQAAEAQQVSNGSFDDGTAGWWATGNLEMQLVAGQLCVDVPGGTTNPWDAIVGQSDITLVEGEGYAFSFGGSASSPAVALGLVQLPVDPYTQFVALAPTLGPEQTTVSANFVASQSLETAQVVFQLGGQAESWTFCLDDVSLLGGVEPPAYEPDTGSRVRVNQVGYLPYGPKRATLVTDASLAVPWELFDGNGQSVASGQSEPKGLDASAGLTVHRIDFTSYNSVGEGYTLVADGETSLPFGIVANAYGQLRHDALSFYYPQRSGVVIDGSIAGEAYGRPAGHVDVSPNLGDGAVGCQPADFSQGVYGEPWTCAYTLDVRGGWYDAGDHGKYVVNGGISVVQLMMVYERTKSAVTARPESLADSTLRIPEQGNGVPDILDEVRWELEFLLAMQVPAGQPLAGMAHHKVHDNQWTGLPLLPHLDPNVRELHRPSTAATLNLAAAAAQGARLFASFDADFAGRLLTAARIAWDAAHTYPLLLAPAADGSSGGGPYDDTDISDEIYWAAAELYLTTGDDVFAAALASSPHHTGQVFLPVGFSWQYVAPLGRMQLATVPNGLDGREQARASVLAGADALLADQATQAFGHPYAPSDGEYAWGSNSQILNNLVVLGTAYDISGATRYRDAVIEGMDYLLGRNALNQSYVTGYGERASENQHSRWYSKQLNPELPNPPRGTVAGGPNSLVSTWDPIAQQLLVGCAPQFCYVDDIGSWATNELTINWNAPLAWVAAFLDDQGDGKPYAPAACEVAYRVNGDWTGSDEGFNAQVWVTNTSDTTVEGWTVSWAFTGAQQVQSGWSASYSQAGSNVQASNLAWNRSLLPGETLTFGFIGDMGELANTDPELFRLNGQPCTLTAAE